MSKELYYMRAFNEDTFNGRHALYSSTGGIGVGLEWLDKPPGVAGGDMRNHIIAAAFPLTRKIRLGSSYEWMTAEGRPGHKAHFWTHSMSSHPGRHISLAIVWYNMNRMKLAGERTASVVTYSSALNFLEHRVQIGIDWVVTSDQGLNDGVYRFGAQADIGHGLVLRGDFDRRGNVYIGAALSLGEFVFGSTNRFEDPGGFQEGVGYIGHRERDQHSRGRPIQIRD